MLKRCYRTQESLVRYWARQAVDLCADIDDPSLTEEYTAPVEETISKMERDRRVVFIGAEGSGKSSLMSLVVGCPLIAKVPMDGPYLRWRYRCTDGDASHSRFLAEEGLMGLEMVDTCACETPEEMAAVAEMLKGADVVVAVLDARAPEKGNAWNLLTSLPEENAPFVMLALTHTDMVPPSAALQLNDDMRALCNGRLGQVVPVYQVCPTSAQGVEVFAARVQEAMEAPNGLRSDIRAVLNAAVELMYKQGSVLKSRDDVSRTDSGFLAGIEQEIDNFLSHQMQGVNACADQYADSVRRVRKQLSSYVRGRFGWFLSPVTLLRLELMGTRAENVYYHLLQKDVLQMQEEADVQFSIACASHWNHVRPRMKQTLECEIGEFPAGALDSDMAQLRAGLGRDLYHPFRQLQLRNDLGGFFKAQIPWMRFFFVLVCVLMALAGFMGFLAQETLALYTLIAAGVMWLLGSMVQMIVGAQVVRRLDELVAPLYGSMRAHLQEVVQNMIISRVSAYRRLYTAPRRKVAEHEATLKPLLDRHNSVYRQLRGSVPHI